MLDYGIVGMGLAGLSFCEQLEQHNKTYVVFDDASQQASLVAGGLYNPIILKRMTLAWKADEQLQVALPFYRGLERKLEIKIDHKVSVMRRFASAAEHNLWFEACDQRQIAPFLSPEIHTNTNPHIYAPFGFGEVRQTGRVATPVLLNAYLEYLLRRGNLNQTKFEYQSLEIGPASFGYLGYRFKKLVFADGFGLRQNPFFNYLPLRGTKGELLTIGARDLKEQRIIKSSVFIIPMGNNLYRIGATYKWKDKTNQPTEGSKSELLQKLAPLLKSHFKVVDHVAGVRPTVTDRRPLVGGHPKYANMYMLNGFGSRGVLIAPYASQLLYKYIEHNAPLPPEMDCTRFAGKFVMD